MKPRSPALRLTAEQRRLVEDHLYLVGHLVRQRWGDVVRRHDREDLEQAGCIGLLRAAVRFDPKRGLKFSTYAAHRIIGECIDYLRQSYGRRGYRRPAVMRESDLRRVEGEDHRIDPAHDDVGLMEQTVASIRARMLWRLMAMYPSRTAEIAMARWFDGMTLAAIGHDFDITEARVSQILRREIRHDIRAMIESEVAA